MGGPQTKEEVLNAIGSKGKMGLILLWSIVGSIMVGRFDL
jgi:hypothetical protein